MPSLLEALDSINLVKLDVHLQATGNGVSIKADLTGLQPAALLGDIGPLFEQLRRLPSNPAVLEAAVRQGLAQLEGLIQLPELGTLTRVAQELGRLVALLDHLLEKLGGDPRALMDQLLQGMGGLEKLLKDIVGRFVDTQPELPNELRAPLQAIAQLAGGIPSPAELGQLLARLLLGLDLETLRAPLDLHARLLARIRLAGGDLEPVRLEYGALTAQIDTVTAMLSVPGADVSQAVALLTSASARMDGLFARLESALERVTADLSGASLDALFGQLRELLRPLQSLARKGEELVDMFVAPLRPLVLHVEAMSAQHLMELFQEKAAEWRAALASAGLDAVAEELDELFTLLVAQFRRVPLRSLRDELLTTLLGLGTRIQEFNGFSTPRLLGDQLFALQRAIETVDTSAIQAQVASFKDKIQSAVDAFPMESIKTELEQAIGVVSGVIQGFIPSVQEVSAQLDALARELDAIQFDAAGKASIDLLGDVRKQVAEVVGSGDVPEPAKMAIGLVAKELKALNVSAEITAPLDDMLGQVDPKLLLAPVEPVLNQVRGTLQKVTPQALIAQLDAPFQEIAAALEQLSPGKLVSRLSEGFQELTALLDQADPRTLIAPLEAEFQRLLGKLRALVDPAPLFAPLHEAYQRLQQLLEALDLEKIFTGLMQQVAELPGTVMGSVKDSLAAKAGGATGPTEAGPGTFQFGDVLRPLAALLAQVRASLKQATAEGLDAALKLLAEPLAALRQIASPIGLVASLTEAVQERRALLDPYSPTGPTVELRRALSALSDVASGQSAEGRLQLEGPLGKLRLAGRVEVLGPRFTGLDAQAGRLRMGPPPDVALSLRRLAEGLQGLPSALFSSAGGAAGALIDSLFDMLDPAPLITELDQLGHRLQAKLASLSGELLKGLLLMWNTLFELLEPLMPVGLLKSVTQGMQRLRTELAVLDPTPIETELKLLVDGVVDGLNAYSPANLAADLGTVFDAVKAKLATLDPATLLGDLDPVAQVIEKFQALRPSVVLAPLEQQAQGLADALAQVDALLTAQALVDAAARLKASLQLVVQGVQQELDSLLTDLEAAAGGGFHADVSVSASLG